MLVVREVCLELLVLLRSGDTTPTDGDELVDGRVGVFASSFVVTVAVKVTGMRTSQVVGLVCR